MKTLDSLGSLFLDARDAVRRLGRKGGLVLLGAGLGFLGAGVGLRLVASGREAAHVLQNVSELRGFATVLFGIAALFLFGGVRQLISPRPARGEERPRLDREELLALARSTRRPFFVCIECRRLWTVVECPGRCPQCGSAADCLEVRTDEDLAMVDSALL